MCVDVINDEIILLQWRKILGRSDNNTIFRENTAKPLLETKVLGFNFARNDVEYIWFWNVFFQVYGLWFSSSMDDKSDSSPIWLPEHRNIILSDILTYKNLLHGRVHIMLVNIYDHRLKCSYTVFEWVQQNSLGISPSNMTFKSTFICLII